MKVDARLLELTNSFLESFFKLANEIELETSQEFENLKAKNKAVEPKICEPRENNSFHFHYTLPDALAQSKQFIENTKEWMGVVLGMSEFSTRMMDNEMQFKTQEYFKDIQYILDNPKEKGFFDRCSFDIKSDEIKTAEFQKFKCGADIMDFSMVNETLSFREVKVNLQNSGNLFNVDLDIIFYEDEQFKDKIKTINAYANKNRFFTSSSRFDYSLENDEVNFIIESQIVDISHIKDINGLFNVIDTAIAELQYDQNSED